MPLTLDELLGCIEETDTASRNCSSLVYSIDPETLMLAVRTFIANLPTYVARNRSEATEEIGRLRRFKMIRAFTACLQALGPD